jgi:hypothetical protein
VNDLLAAFILGFVERVRTIMKAKIDPKKGSPYDVNAPVDLRKASLANVIHTLELTDDLV